MLGRRSKTATEPAPDLDTSAPPDTEINPAQQPKGRATPKRKDAQATRKQAHKVPSDPKAAKKAMKDRERDARMEARAGLMAGDERYLPPRDQGPAKAFTRDLVDGRRRAAEFFLFIAVAILLAGFLPNQEIRTYSTIFWLVVVALIILETVWMLVTLRRQLMERWPDKPDRKGCMNYAVMRSLQIRKLRVPPPRLKANGQPVDPKPGA